MKKITLEEFTKLDKKAGGVDHPVIREILNLEPKQGLVIEKHEWAKHTSLSKTVAWYRRKLNRKIVVRALADGSGWAVLRK